MLLRLEDVDRDRSRQDVEQAIRDDLGWLGLTWDAETLRQSLRDYRPALTRLMTRSYHCRCTRAMRDLPLPVAAGCPGACLRHGYEDGAVRFRLDAAVVSFIDRRRGWQHVDLQGVRDPVLVRADGQVSYNLAVVADDIADGVTEVVRGGDLLDHTAVQVQLWQALGAAPPEWLHTPVIVGADGRKLSKSHGSAHVGALRDAGATPADVWRTVLPWLGVANAASLDDALPQWRPDRIALGPLIQRG